MHFVRTNHQICTDCRWTMMIDAHIERVEHSKLAETVLNAQFA